MLHFDVDITQLLQVTEDLGATSKQVVLSLKRALNRTLTSLRKSSVKDLKRELMLGAASNLRSRVKQTQMRIKNNEVKADLWFGLNPVSASSLKGRAKQESWGASKQNYLFKDGFVGKMPNGHHSIFKRKGKARLKIEEQTVAIEEDASDYVESEVFDEVLTVFWGHFERDLRARVKYQIGAS
ncbi:phage tail protein [Aeromonas hydrophila]|uniref:phage tail protein n=1 Tax=Aeromonas hydrophila TaxID=644 RepID=UPI0023607EC8|nr:phage tail protein [Aeromonas hydrophila]